MPTCGWPWRISGTQDLSWRPRVSLAFDSTAVCNLGVVAVLDTVPGVPVDGKPNIIAAIGYVVTANSETMDGEGECTGPIGYLPGDRVVWVRTEVQGDFAGGFHILSVNVGATVPTPRLTVRILAVSFGIF